MTEQKTEQEEVSLPVSEDTTVAISDSAVPVVPPKEENRPPSPRRGGFGRGRGGERRGGPRGGRDERRSEFAQKLISLRRVARVMAGGRRFNFSAALVLGDKKGRVGVGMGKAADTTLAIEKATRDAKRNMLTIELTKNRSIKHNIAAKYCASVVEIRPSQGRGLVAGSSVRAVLELGGVSDVTAKLLSRSKNSVNNARATIEALRQLSK